MPNINLKNKAKEIYFRSKFLGQVKLRDWKKKYKKTKGLVTKFTETNPCITISTSK